MSHRPAGGRGIVAGRLGRAGAGPGHEVGGQQEVAAGGREPEQQLGGAAALLAAVLADRGQRGLRGGGGRHVVEPDHGEAAGHGDPAVGGRLQRAEREPVAHRQHAGGRPRRVEQRARGGPPGLRRVAERLADGDVVPRQPGRLDRLAVAGETLAGEPVGGGALPGRPAIAAATPALYAIAGRRAGATGRTAAISAVATVGYLGFLAGPPLVGALASVISLRGALGALTALIAVLLAAVPLLGRIERDATSTRPALEFKST